MTLKVNVGKNKIQKLYEKTENWNKTEALVKR